MRKLLLALPMLVLSPATSGADVFVPFTLGPTGDQGTNTLNFFGAIQATAFGGTLYVRDEPDDHGLGVCQPTGCEGFSNGNELEPGEAIHLQVTAPNYFFSGLWISSLDHEEAGFYVGPHEFGVFQAGVSPFDLDVEYLLPLYGVDNDLWIGTNGYGGGFLVGGALIHEVNEVPEPASLVLLGSGLLASTWGARCRTRLPKGGARTTR